MKTIEHKNYIGGRWKAASDGATFEQRNPADLEELTGFWPSSTRADAAEALETAREAFASWSALSPFQRAEFLGRALANMKDRREDLALVLTLENGKTLGESKAEVDAAIKEMEWQIAEGARVFGETAPSAWDGVFAYSVRRPLGVVSVISPWNFPFNVPGRKVTPALMAGNTCVLKPASLTPQTGALFVRLFADAGLPPGVLNLVTGSGSTVGQELISNPIVKAISFTGSTDVGRRIHRKAAAVMARTQLEMGGKNPIVVLEDADLEQAARAAVKAAYACAGQWCTSTSRAIVMDAIADRFTNRVAELASELVVGDGRDDSTEMGPVCGTEQMKTIGRYLELGVEQGARLVTGGKPLTDGGLHHGCFIAPTVFADVEPGMAIAREEIFGPVLSVMRARDFDHAVELANDVDFGLASSIYTESLKSAFTFVERSDVGLAHVNMMTALKEPQLSFGGVKASGHGLPEAGHTGIEFFTEHKVVYVKYR